MSNPTRPSVNAQARKCLICNVSIRECHLGIDSCRACTVFYKRTISKDKSRLRCKKGTGKCFEDESNTSCRKCRFQRFSDVLLFALAKEQKETAEPEEECGLEFEPEPSTSTFIDHSSFTLSPSASNDTPLLSRISQGYSLMCVIRKAGELQLRPAGYTATLEGSDDHNIPFTPCTYSILIALGKVFTGALIEFGNATFEDFRNLSADEKDVVVKTSYKFVSVLESTYRAVHYFPDCDTGVPGYTFFLNGETIEKFFDDCPHPINKEEAIKSVTRNQTELSRMSKGHYKKVRPTDDEFVMLLGLAFWNQEISAKSEKLESLVDRNRNYLMAEVHVAYKKQGRDDYATRLGELLCLMANLVEVCTLAQQDKELYRLMNFFTEKRF